MGIRLKLIGLALCLCTAVVAFDLVVLQGQGPSINQVIDAEASGNTITVPFVRDVPLANCIDATAASPLNLPGAALAPVPTCVSGTNVRLAVLKFDDDGAERQIQGAFYLPADWAGAIDLRGKWRAADTSGNVAWQVATACVADAETSDPAWNTAQVIQDAAKGTTLQQNDFAQAGITATGCTSGELFTWKFFRDSDHASDDLATATSGEADLISLAWTVRRAM